MTKQEAAVVEKFTESAINLQRDMQKIQQQFSTLGNQFSTILSRLEKLEGKQPTPKQNDSFQVWEDFENGVTPMPDKRFS